MKRITNMTRYVLLGLTVVLMTSAVPVSKKEAPAAKVTEAPSVMDYSLTNMTNAEMFRHAEALKGSKLTLKEKIALKVFKKQAIKHVDAPAARESGKSQLIALILVILVGGLGIHRFYLGYTTIGIIQLLTLGGCGVWALIDLIRIAMGTLQPANGPYTETL